MGRPFPLLLLSFLLGWSVAFGLQKEEYLMTVAGKIPVENLGRTLVHEHVLTHFGGTDSSDHRTRDIERAMNRVLPDLTALWEGGYNTLVECTPSHIGKDVLLLRELAQRSGLQIITNTGYYAAVDKKYLPEVVRTQTAEELATAWEADWLHGIGNTGVRPGFIKLGVGNGALDSLEKKLVTAGMLLSKRSGLTLYVHTGGDESILSQAALAATLDFNLNKLVWVHAQNGSDAVRSEMARKGVWVSLDGVSMPRLDTYINMVCDMKDRGLLHRLLLSHDDGWSARETSGGLEMELFDNGNTAPYTTLESHLLPALRNRGFSETELTLLLVENPARALAIAPAESGK